MEATVTAMVLRGSYEPSLVILSVVIATLASYAALDLAGRVAASRGVTRLIWLAAGAAAMGLGIWSMHYVGMLAFRLPVLVAYDWPTVLLSLLAAIVASLIALYVVSRETMGTSRVILGSVFMGLGIAGMHYIGMAAMRLPAMCHYSPGIVTASILLAVVIAYVALRLAFHFRREQRSGGWRKVLSAVVMGAAIPVMHYTGMVAATFVPSDGVHGGLAHAINISPLGVSAVIAVTFMVLSLTILTAMVDRVFSAKTAELASSEIRSRQILETSFDSFVAMNAAGRITDWNVQAERMFGWPRSEVIGKPLLDTLIPLPHRGACRSQIAPLFVADPGSVSSKRFETRAITSENRELPVEFTVSVIRCEGSNHFAAFVRDLTDYLEAQKALRDAKEASEAANQAKSTFLATMSHEIRTPMNGILGITELVLDSELTREQRENLHLVRISAESLLTIINDVLDFSKIEAGKMGLEEIPFDFRESLGETMKAIGFRAHEKGLELIYDVHPSVPEALLGDPGRIRQILINLVGNSIKFTAKGEIAISVEEASSSEGATLLHFRVKDSGIGIPLDKQSRIFEAFAQADGSTTRQYGGTGLGLTICRRLVGMMGGKIWVESQPGSGSTFHFTLRLQISTAPRPASSAADPGCLRGLPVLIVDDNQTNRLLLSQMLERWGMAVTSVDSGQAALLALQSQTQNSPPVLPLVLIDGHMPEMDGFTLAAHIKTDPALAPCGLMMLTSGGQKGDAARCRDLGIAAYLVKPIRQSELLEALCNLLGAAPESKPALITRHTLREARQRLRILLAEDNAVNQTLAVRLLERRGYTVVVALNGREAVEKWHSLPFDLILMDVQMPEMDGFAATAAIRLQEQSSQAHIPIVAMTAHALNEDRERCLAAGMDAFVTKPIRRDELFSTIEEVTAGDPKVPATMIT